jgi:two-component system CheB/CheR fusion protein
VVVTFLDVTGRRRMEDALRASEAQLKREMQLVELSRAPIFVWDFDDGIVDWNRGSEELYGYSRDEAIGQIKNSLLKTGVPNSSFDKLRNELLEKGGWRGELRQVAKGGRPLIVESQIELVSTDGRRYGLESVRDITDKKRMEERQQLLVTELTHRVKNMLAVVQGMVHQTSHNSDSAQDFVKRLDGRISALSDSQRLLIDSNWKGASLRKLIENQLAPYIGDDKSRLHLKGENISLPADIAIPMGLVLHELATNALKYGAFAGVKGRVDLSWNLNFGNNSRVLKVHWREHDGPPVKTSSTTGFGSRLISKGLPGAKVEHEFLVDGVSCSIELHLPPEE